MRPGTLPRALLLLAFGVVGAAAPATASPDDDVLAMRVEPPSRVGVGVSGVGVSRPETNREVTPELDQEHDAELPRATSTGWPWRGRLLDAVRLQASDRVHLVDADLPAGRHYGTMELVGLIARVAARVDRAVPGAKLQVGELSGPSGGNIPGHRSHENGRDVDLGFYFLDAETGEPVNLPRFVNQTRRGARLDARALRFDDERNWRLVEALATDETAPVQHAFVHRDIRARLLRTGKRLGASAELLERVERIVISPGVEHPHRNHFHVRIYCPAEDVTSDRRSTCRDRGPYWPWLPSAHPWQARVVPLPGYPPRDEESATPVRLARRD